MLLAKFPVLSPACLRRATQDITPLLSADVAPARRTKAKREPLDWWWRQLSRCYIKEFQRQIEKHFRRKTGLSHHDLEPLSASRTQCARKLRAHFDAVWI
jgi:hypothetical protein